MNNEHHDGTSHRFFLFETKTTFEPYAIDNEIVNVASEPLYLKVDYAILSCNCGEVIRRKVRKEDHDA